MNTVAKAMSLAAGGISVLWHYENPLMTKELRTRMRGARAHWTMLGYVLALSLIIFGAYYFRVWMNMTYSGTPFNWWQVRVGRDMFMFLTWAQTILLSLIGLSLTAGAITIEIQQQTMEMLSLTSLSTRNIIAGKTGAAVLSVWMILLSSVPLAGICLVFGGISPIEIVVVYLLLAAWVFLICAIGTFWSSMLTKTNTATFNAYGSAFAYGMIASMFGSGEFTGSGHSLALAALNPAVAAMQPLAVAQVFGVPVPTALAAFAVNAWAGILLLTISQTQLRYQYADKALAVRLQLLGLSAFVIVLLFGNVAKMMVTHTPSRSTYFGLSSFMISTIMCIIFASIAAFATGVLKREAKNGGVLATVMPWLSIRKAFTKDIKGGLTFIFIWLGLCALIGVAVLGYVGGWKYIPQFLQVMVSVAVVAAAYFSVGIIASTIGRTRIQAIVLVVGFIILSNISYLAVVINYEFGPREHKPLYELAYLWPPLPVVTLASEFKPDVMGPKLRIPPRAHWLAVSISHALLCFVFLEMAEVLRRRCKGITYE